MDPSARELTRHLTARLLRVQIPSNLQPGYRLNFTLAAMQGTDASSSADTGAQRSKNGVEWKSTADSSPNPKSASLSKESIVPQRSPAVHDQPKAEDPHSKGEAAAQACIPVVCQSKATEFLPSSLDCTFTRVMGIHTEVSCLVYRLFMARLFFKFEECRHPAAIFFLFPLFFLRLLCIQFT